MSTIEYPNTIVSKKGALPSVPFLRIKEKVLGKKYSLSISFVDEKLARKLNIKFRNKSYIPNTLSFSLSKTSGEIVLCQNIIKKEAKKYSLTEKNFLILLLIHSMLHLKGMAHGSTMETKEQKYFASLKQK